MDQNVAKDLYVKVVAQEIILKNILERTEVDHPGFKAILLQSLSAPPVTPPEGQMADMFYAALKEAKRIIEERG